MAEAPRRAAREPGEATRRRPAVAGERARARRTLQSGAVTRAQTGPGTGPLDRPAGETRSAPRRAVPSWPARGTGLVVLAVCLVVALATTAALLSYRARQAGQVGQGRDAALTAAQAHAEDILSYDYRTLDDDFARARAAITGSFAKDYEVTTTKVVRPPAQKYKAVVKAKVAAGSVVRGDAERATVLLFVNQTTTSTRLDGPKVDLNRVRMTMVKVDGEWLVSDIAAL